MKENAMVMERNRQEIRQDNVIYNRIRDNNIKTKKTKARKGACDLAYLDEFLGNIEEWRRLEICRLISAIFNSDADWELENDNVFPSDIYNMLIGFFPNKKFWSLKEICNVLNMTTLNRYRRWETKDIKGYNGHEEGWLSFIDRIA